MPRCLNHEQVAKRFIDDLLDLCAKHNIAISSNSLINVHIEPVYNKETGLYEEYGADFTLGRLFPRHVDLRGYNEKHQ